ncbi:MAG: FRG domain-containing protein [Acidobacteriota bacterium]|nr:FRG domain-containing protein [Acidobacteriota bacterium]
MNENTSANQPDNFRVYKPKTWGEVIRLSRHFPGWAFRGVGDSRWTMQHSLERSIERFATGNQDRLAVEKKLILEFQKSAHLFFPAEILPETSDWFGWMSLIQHYGGPTRLLDFTRSFYCAAFFALENPVPEATAAIWCVNLPKLNSEDQRHRLKGEGRSLPSLKVPTIQERVYSAIEEERENGLDLGVYPYEPSRLHQRLAYQQGLFLVPTRAAGGFHKQILKGLKIDAEEFGAWEACPSEDCPPYADPKALLKLDLVKIDLKPEIHQEGRADLKQMNLTSMTLFPGPDGYARSLHWLLESGRLREEFDLNPSVLSGQQIKERERMCKRLEEE